MFRSYKPQPYPPTPHLLPLSLAVIYLSQTPMLAVPAAAAAAEASVTVSTFRTSPVHSAIYTADVLWEQPARSRVECSVMCRRDARCLMVTFRPGADGPPGSCRSHQKVQSPTSTKEEGEEELPGARSLALVAPDWINKRCSFSSDCTEPLAACYSGQCVCDRGYFFDPTMNACVSSCWWGRGEDVLMYRQWDLDGHDMFRESGRGDPDTVCKARCREDPRCVSFAYNGRFDLCYFKNVTVQNFPRDWMQRSPVTFYQMTCARPAV